MSNISPSLWLYCTLVGKESKQHSLVHYIYFVQYTVSKGEKRGRHLTPYFFSITYCAMFPTCFVHDSRITILSAHKHLTSIRIFTANPNSGNNKVIVIKEHGQYSYQDVLGNQVENRSLLLSQLGYCVVFMTTGWDRIDGPSSDSMSSPSPSTSSSSSGYWSPQVSRTVDRARIRFF